MNKTNTNYIPIVIMLFCLLGFGAYGQITNSPILNTNGLIVFYGFNESSIPPWSPISAVGDTTTLTNVNGCTNSAPGLGVSGTSPDRAASFYAATTQGTSTLGARGPSKDTNLDNLTAFTLSGWYFCKTGLPIVSANRLLSCLTTAQGGFEVQGNPNGPGISLQMWGGGSAQRSTTNAIFGETNKWVFWAVTWNDTNGAVSFYAGDSTTPVAAFGSSTFITSPNTAFSTNLTVGNLYALSRGFDGYMDDVAIYSNALTIAQLESNREANLGFGQIVRSSGPASLLWKGDGTINNWDVDTSTNWINGVTPDVFYDSDNVTFDDTGSASPVVNLTASLYPGNVVVTNQVENYIFGGSGGFLAMSGLTKEGAASLTISNSAVNNFSGSITVVGGTLRVAGTNNRLPAGSSVTLSNTAGVSLDINSLTETVGPLNGGGATGGGVTLETGTLVFAGTGGNYSGVISGAGNVVMNGAGAYQILSGTNSYVGGTIVSNGTLVVDNSTGFATGTNNVVISGGALQFGNDDAKGYIAEPSGFLTNNGTVIFARSDNFTPPANIVGSGSIAQGAGISILNQNYDISTNWIVYNSNGVMQISSANVFGSTSSQVTVIGGNTPTPPGPGGDLAMAGGIVFAPYSLTLGCRGLVASTGWECPPSFVNSSGSNTWTGNISIVTGGNLVEIDSDGGFMNIQGNIAPTTGTGRTLILGGTANGIISGVIQDGTGDFNLGVNGTGTWTLSNANTYTGTTIVSNGTLLVDGSILDGDVDVGPGTLGGVGQLNVNADNAFIFANGTLAPGDPATTGTLTFDGNLTVAGNYIFKINKSLAQSNDFVVVDGSLNNTGTGAVTLNNYGPALAVGDTFTLFNQPLAGGNTLAISGPPGVTFTNNLALNGSVSVLSVSAVNQSPTNIVFTVSGNQLTLSWPADHTGWQLQAQTNSLGAGLSTNWVNVSGSQSTNQVNFNVNPANGCVFYRLVYP